jgi:hypothetical protein
VFDFFDASGDAAAVSGNQLATMVAINRDRSIAFERSGVPIASFDAISGASPTRAAGEATHKF